MAVPSKTGVTRMDRNMVSNITKRDIELTKSDKKKKVIDYTKLADSTLVEVNNFYKASESKMLTLCKKCELCIQNLLKPYLANNLASWEVGSEVGGYIIGEAKTHTGDATTKMRLIGFRMFNDELLFRIKYELRDGTLFDYIELPSKALTLREIKSAMAYVNNYRHKLK